MISPLDPIYSQLLLFSCISLIYPINIAPPWMECHMDNMQIVMSWKATITLLFQILLMSFFNVDVMDGGLIRRKKLMCKFGMMLVAISSSTSLKVPINYFSTIFTMEGTCSIVMFLRSDKSTPPMPTMFKDFQTLTRPHHTSSSLVSSSPLMALLHILTIIMPKERGKLKQGLAYYDFIYKRTRLPLPLFHLNPFLYIMLHFPPQLKIVMPLNVALSLWRRKYL
jgi:hypothetical protein